MSTFSILKMKKYKVMNLWNEISNKSVEICNTVLLLKLNGMYYNLINEIYESVVTGYAGKS